MTGTVLLILRILLAMLLYAFLAYVLYTLWRDLRRQTELQTARQVRPLKLTFDGVDEELHFSQLEVIIGRGRNCDVMLDDKTVSGRHARMAYHHGQWWLEDLASTNGTFLNADPVSAAVVLTHGDQIRCGQVSGKIGLE